MPLIDNAVQKSGFYSMTNPVRLRDLYCQVERVLDEDIKGDFVEAGVYRGGSVMCMAYALRYLKGDRKIWLYDTFSGMTEPGEQDFKTGSSYEASLNRWNKNKASKSNKWNYECLMKVQKNVYSTEYPRERFKFVKGDVCETIPKEKPGRIAILRLDTDFYKSTKHLLEHLYPRLSSGGVLIIDDYGAWHGCRLAVQEFFDEKNLKLSDLNTVDRSCVTFRKP